MSGKEEDQEGEEKGGTKVRKGGEGERKIYREDRKDGRNRETRVSEERGRGERTTREGRKEGRH